MTILLTIATVLVAIALLGALLLKFYHTATPEMALVRTGMGGPRTVLTGGVIVVPGFHNITKVSLKTHRLNVERSRGDSLITANRMRVDVVVEFFVRVKADEAAVLQAAQTIGNFDEAEERLRKLTEAKLVDALRATAVQMDMYELNSKRAEFVKKVRETVATDIASNGLEFESVSLTSLNQTLKSFFNPENALDAEGLLFLTRETEARRMAVNEVEQNTAVGIQRKNLEATREKQQLTLEQERVELTTAQEIAQLTATQQAAVAAAQADAHRRQEEARLQADLGIRQTRIEVDRAESTAKIDAQAAVTLNTQARNAETATASKFESEARASAAKAEAEAIAAREGVETARILAIAEREKSAALVAAERAAREETTPLVIRAQAERDAAENRAEALIRAASAERDAVVLRAEGIAAEGSAVAQAAREKNEAANLMTPAQIEMNIRMAVLAALPSIVEASVKPLASIDSIRIAEVGGLAGAINGGGGSSASVGGGAPVNGASGGLADQVVNGALRYRANAPLVDALMREVGLAGGGDISKLLHDVSTRPAIEDAREVGASVEGATAAGAEGGSTVAPAATAT